MPSAELGNWLEEHQIAVTHSEVSEGGYLFRRNDPVRQLHVIAQGTCQLERTTLDGRALPLALLGPGQAVAEGSLFNDRYGCDCRVVDCARVRSYPRQAVLDLMIQQPTLALDWLSALAHQVMELRTRLELRNVKSARERITLHLALQADAQGRYTVPLSYKSLAQELGLSHEALYRTLARMEQAGEIRRGPRMIQIIGTVSSCG